jgi:hypothetical protein
MDSRSTSAETSFMAQRSLRKPVPSASLRLRRFDMCAFHAALDAARQEGGLSWAKLAAETNRPL